MGIQRTGGFIGRRAVPTQTSASGLWHFSEVEAANRASIWPVPSPAAISGLQLWIDASDSSTLYDATTGGSLVAADGTVARWEDKSGNARHFTQATSNVRPVRKTNVKNSLDAIAFTNDWLGSVFTYTVGSFFLVWNHPTTVAGDAQPAIFGSRSSSSDKVANGTLPLTMTMASATVVAMDPSPSGVTARLNGASATGNFFSYGFGLSVRTSPNRWNYTSATFTAVTGQKSFVLGADSYSSVRFMQDGHIGEVIAYSGALTSTQVLAVEAYLVNKWGL